MSRHVKYFLNSKYAIARSETKKLLSDLAGEVVLDFEGIEWISQGFADEAFRVYPNHHPGVTVKAINASPDVERMIRHVTAGAQ